jgi:hypothetical protein
VANWVICHDVIDVGLVLHRSEGPDPMLLEVGDVGVLMFGLGISLALGDVLKLALGCGFGTAALQPQIFVKFEVVSKEPLDLPFVKLHR